MKTTERPAQQPRIHWTRPELHRELDNAAFWYRYAVSLGPSRGPFVYQFGPADAHHLYYRGRAREAIERARSYRVAASGLLP